jgi:hypothetical protein
VDSKSWGMDLVNEKNQIIIKKKKKKKIFPPKMEK